MDPRNVAVLAAVFVGLLAFGVPISVAIGLASLATLARSMSLDTATITVAQRIATGLDRFTLLAIPFFILSGELMNRGGVARRLVELARALVGMLPGGLAHVSVVAGMLFGAISGSAVAAVAAVGGFMIPRMREQGYDKDFRRSTSPRRRRASSSRRATFSSSTRSRAAVSRSRRSSSRATCPVCSSASASLPSPR